jgi:hypothetical protein
MNSIVVREVVGGNAVSMSAGTKLRELILNSWARSGEANVKLVLDFSGIEVFASPFFNASIGALLKDREIGELQARLGFEGISDHGKSILNLVIANAIKFYGDKSGAVGRGLDEARKGM